MKRPPSLCALAALALGLSTLGCEEPPQPVAPAPGAKAPGAQTPGAQTPGAQTPGAKAAGAKPARIGLGTIREAGKTFRPTHSVIVWNQADQELSFHLFPFAPSEAEIEQIRNGQSFISFNKPSPDARQWPEHCPSATYALSWARKPKEAIGDLSQARYVLHLHGISKKNANMSINRLSVTGDLQGKISEGEQIQLSVKDSEGSSESPIDWDLVLAGRVQIPPPPPEAPKLTPDQRGKLGVVTFGAMIYKVEGALAKRDPKEQLARILLLPRPPTPDDLAAYRAGKFSLGEQQYVELYVFCGKEGFGSPPAPSQRKLIFKGSLGSLSSFFMNEGEFSMSGSLDPGQKCGLKAKGLALSRFSSSRGKIASWELNLGEIEVLDPGAKSD